MASGVATFMASLTLWVILKAITGIRVSEEAEINGLDMAELGMEAYPEFGKGSPRLLPLGEDWPGPLDRTIFAPHCDMSTVPVRIGDQDLDWAWQRASGSVALANSPLNRQT